MVRARRTGAADRQIQPHRHRPPPRADRPDHRAAAWAGRRHRPVDPCRAVDKCGAGDCARAGADAAHRTGRTGTQIRFRCGRPCGEGAGACADAIAARPVDRHRQRATGRNFAGGHVDCRPATPQAGADPVAAGAAFVRLCLAAARRGIDQPADRHRGTADDPRQCPAAELEHIDGGRRRGAAALHTRSARRRTGA